MIEFLLNNKVLMDYLIFKIEDIKFIMAFIGIIGGGLSVISITSNIDCFGNTRKPISKTHLGLIVFATIFSIIITICALILPSAKELSYLLTGNQTYYEHVRIRR